MSEETVPNWLLKLEEQREKRLKAKLGHEAGAGASCNTCRDKCPGLDLHFWRKICKACKCSKEDHDVNDDDVYGYVQFQLLGKKPTKAKSIVLTGKDDAIVLDWTPTGSNNDVKKYLDELPEEMLPVKGSEAAKMRKQRLQRQMPAHDIDASLCHALTNEEISQLEEYVAHIRNHSVGQGKVIQFSLLRGQQHKLGQPKTKLLTQQISGQLASSETVDLQQAEMANNLQNLSISDKTRNQSLPETVKNNPKLNYPSHYVPQNYQHPVTDNQNPLAFKNNDIIYPQLSQSDPQNFPSLHGNMNQYKNFPQNPINPYNQDQRPTQVKERTLHYPLTTTNVERHQEQFNDEFSPKNPYYAHNNPYNTREDDTNNPNIYPQNFNHPHNIVHPQNQINPIEVAEQTNNPNNYPQNFNHPHNIVHPQNQINPIEVEQTHNPNNYPQNFNHPHNILHPQNQVNPLEVEQTNNPNNYPQNFNHPHNVLHPQNQINPIESEQTMSPIKYPSVKDDINNPNYMQTYKHPQSILHAQNKLNPIEMEQNLSSVGFIRDITYPPNPNLIPDLTNSNLTIACHGCKKFLEDGAVAISLERTSHLWHPNCFKCKTCNQYLADLMYFYHKDTDSVYCGRDYALMKGIPRCAACDELIFVREYTLAEDATFHVKHFCCFECDQPLAGKQYVMEGNQPVCLDCYEKTKAEKCQECGIIISADQQGVSLKDLHWHADPLCFACKNCRVSLRGRKMLLRNQNLFCSDICYKAFQ